VQQLPLHHLHALTQ